MAEEEDFEEFDTEQEETTIEELEERLQELESRLGQGIGNGGAFPVGIYGLGSILAAILSWDGNRAILWAAIHCIFSWLYVIYSVIVRWESMRFL